MFIKRIRCSFLAVLGLVNIVSAGEGEELGVYLYGSRSDIARSQEELNTYWSSAAGRQILDRLSQEERVVTQDFEEARKLAERCPKLKTLVCGKKWVYDLAVTHWQGDHRPSYTHLIEKPKVLDVNSIETFHAYVMERLTHEGAVGFSFDWEHLTEQEIELQNQFLGVLGTLRDEYAFEVDVYINPREVPGVRENGTGAKEGYSKTLAICKSYDWTVTIPAYAWMPKWYDETSQRINSRGERVIQEESGVNRKDATRLANICVDRNVSFKYALGWHRNQGSCRWQENGEISSISRSRMIEITMTALLEQIAGIPNDKKYLMKAPYLFALLHRLDRKGQDKENRARIINEARTRSDIPMVNGVVVDDQWLSYSLFDYQQNTSQLIQFAYDIINR